MLKLILSGEELPDARLTAYSANELGRFLRGNLEEGVSTCLGLVTKDMDQNDVVIVSELFGIYPLKRPTLEAVGNAFGVSHERIRQREEGIEKALRKVGIFGHGFRMKVKKPGTGKGLTFDWDTDSFTSEDPPVTAEDYMV